MNTLPNLPLDILDGLRYYILKYKIKYQHVVEDIWYESIL